MSYLKIDHVDCNFIIIVAVYHFSSSSRQACPSCFYEIHPILYTLSKTKEILGTKCEPEPSSPKKNASKICFCQSRSAPLAGTPMLPVGYQYKYGLAINHLLNEVAEFPGDTHGFGEDIYCLILVSGDGLPLYIHHGELPLNSMATPPPYHILWRAPSPAYLFVHDVPQPHKRFIERFRCYFSDVRLVLLHLCHLITHPC